MLFAVVEFAGADAEESNNEVAVVPLSWLDSKGIRCQWPLSTKKMKFSVFVESLTTPKKSWPSFPIYKIHSKISTFEEAELKLEEVLQYNEQQVEESGGAVASLFKKKHPADVPDEDSHDTNDTMLRNVNESQKSSKIIIESDFLLFSPDSVVSRSTINSDRDSGASTSKIPQSREAFDDVVSKSTIICSDTSTPTTLKEGSDNVVSKSTIIRSGPSTPTTLTSRKGFEENVTIQLARLNANVDQQSVLLNRIYGILQTQKDSAASLQPPDDLPRFPIDNLNDFEEFNGKLNNEVFANYVVLRLAAVGGSGIESHTRRMLQFILTNDLAQRFNWKGKDKISFETAKIMEIIYDAGKRTFPQNERSDYIIANTVKEWLKYAKQRVASKKIKLSK